ncbi:NAD(P)/FAD-dependent oxidoreductase [Streptacidiphilus sp. EB129]|uniref:NAD(P)/FAD-dependent oxidoreductase n=1 Tax=Streptacidiphilus sp. EB129 TaxID=3156262 RepID=UPI0035110439
MGANQMPDPQPTDTAAAAPSPKAPAAKPTTRPTTVKPTAARAAAKPAAAMAAMAATTARPTSAATPGTEATPTTSGATARPGATAPAAPAAGAWWEGAQAVGVGDSALPDEPLDDRPERSGAPDRERVHEVAVLGAHLGGGMLAAVLAEGGVDVVLVDAPQDASTPAGESTVPYTAEVFDLLARRFDVPELSALGHFGQLPTEVRSTSGVKKSIGFVYSEPGRRVRPNHLLQFNVPSEHGESHLFRPDIEAWVHRAAVTHGARIPAGRSALTAVRGGPGDFRIELADGSTVRARFVVDMAGQDAPMLERLGPATVLQSLRHSSRVLTAHLRGVLPLERQVVPGVGGKPWSGGTTHFVFPGGWVQQVTFNNHVPGNALVTSVAVSLDPKIWPQTTLSPAQEFNRLTARFPELAWQFETAVAVRPWSGGDQWQYGATRTVGEGFLLLDRSAGRNDLVLSRDVTMTAELVHAAAVALLSAHRSNDWSTAHFRPLESFQAELIEHNDRLLEMALAATVDFRLWNAFCRVWLLHSMFAALSLKRARNDALARPGTPGQWQQVDQYRGCGFWFPVYPGFAVLFDDAYRVLRQVSEDRLAPGEAADRIFAQLASASFLPPLFGFGDPQDRYYNFTPPKRLKVLLWAKRSAPPLVRRALTRG